MCIDVYEKSTSLHTDATDVNAESKYKFFNDAHPSIVGVSVGLYMQMCGIAPLTKCKSVVVSSLKLVAFPCVKYVITVPVSAVMPLDDTTPLKNSIHFPVHSILI